MKNKWVYLTLGILLVALLSIGLKAGISKPSTIPLLGSKKLHVWASFYPVYFFSSQIGGDKAEVRNITPAGAEPHDYDPSTQDIARIENGDMLVLNGSVESWGDKMMDNLKGTKVKIVIAGEGLFTKDPHIWLDPALAKKGVKKITEGYIAVDPVNTAYYKDNEKKLDSQLDELDAEYKKGLQNCQSKDIVTSHGAFAYLAQAYDLNQVAISGLSPDEEPSAKQLADVANFVKKNHIKYIFFESLVSPKLSETIANEVGAKTLVLDPIEGISDDGIAQGKNYFTAAQDNLKNLQTALQCNN